ncbi:hypothetical protein EsVE80_13990 [Enterococcus saigonensis]|uniref:Uncharacterized protein n=1 Tax=Enterococcus saigonensis TaxID=1805431 RepID=A0A679IKT7_9ENTE|nr:hypothetical protein [Enterococcus saigonensis]BCA85876.1 hypothetical protein EsVE80_13990 [Enterococcus saigonensis]
MPFIAILIDALTLGAYFLQLNNNSNTLRFLGLIFQGVMTVLLLLLLIGYHGKRHTGYRPEGYSYFTIRFGIMVFSFLINAIVLFLYILNFIGANNLIFSNF